MFKTREIDVYWTVQHGQKWSASLSDTAARESLNTLAVYEEDPTGWTIECTREMVLVISGELVEGGGEAITLDDRGCETSNRSYNPVHVFWQCPLCDQRHNGNIRNNPLDSESVVSNPSLWFCEQGKGLVLLSW